MIEHNDTAQQGEGDPPVPSRSSPEGEPLETFIERAAAHTHMGTEAPLGRFGPIKRWLLRVLRLVTRDQITFNVNTAAALQNLAWRVNAVGEVVEAVQLRQDRLEGSIEPIRDTERLSRVVEELSDRQRHDRDELLEHRAQVDAFLREARRRLPEEFDRDQLASFSEQLAARLHTLYSDFPDSFRGDAEGTKELLSEHLEAVEHLSESDRPVLDLGFGRGEWLELLAEHGIPAYGIDISEEFVESARARGLDARLGDALEHLRGLPAGSLGAVTGFHIIEHLTFETLVELLEAAYRALGPGGVALFETPNSTNLSVGACNFYMDPTHRNPIPPQLAELLLRWRGFENVEIRHLHPSPELEVAAEAIEAVEDPRIRHLFEHVGRALFGPQDYAVLGKKP